MSDRRHARIDALLDGELAPEEANAARAHVAGCAACREALAGAQAVERALREPVAASAPGFASLTRERALARRLPGPPLWWLALPLAWRAGLAALLAVAALAGARIGHTRAADRADAAQLAAAFDAPATDAMLAPGGTGAPR